LAAPCFNGGTLGSPEAFPADGPIVRRVIGPSSRGKGILGGMRHAVGPGDIVVIPPHMPHGLVEIRTPRIVYTLVRIDPQKRLELRGKAD
jgi:hypothetical protein